MIDQTLVCQLPVRRLAWLMLVLMLVEFIFDPMKVLELLIHLMETVMLLKWLLAKGE